MIHTMFELSDTLRFHWHSWCHLFLSIKNRLILLHCCGPFTISAMKRRVSAISLVYRHTMLWCSGCVIVCFLFVFYIMKEHYKTLVNVWHTFALGDHLYWQHVFSLTVHFVSSWWPWSFFARQPSWHPSSTVARRTFSAVAHGNCSFWCTNLSDSIN